MRQKNAASVWIKENRICRTAEIDHEGRSHSVSESVLVNGFDTVSVANAVAVVVSDDSVAVFEDAA